ncbi:MAG: Gfo/Idh/MocA family oxidoreductase [Lentisphaeraceae bacterium]|nr:Gfo/Idh/MocA family oxidoreductase [Lentisphaeraceae bacterium]
MNGVSRRNFLKTGAVAAAVSGIVPNIMAQSAKGSNDVINVALIGCGGRGLGAAANAMNADPKVRLVAIADAFEDRLSGPEVKLKGYGDRAVVAKDKRFVGFDGYKKIMALPEVDMVILTTPPHFRPIHIEAAAAAGKHIFAEKPLATDPAGLKRAAAAVEVCKQKGLTFVTGFCYRFDKKKQETVKRIQEGMIGDVKNIQCSYNTGALWVKPRQTNWSNMEWQMRNWLYFTWLSGDHIVEQGIHNIDKMGWVTGDKAPKYAYAMGGRQSRTDEKFGNVFDHFSVQYEFDSGVYANFTCRQQRGTDAGVQDVVTGTEGKADLMRHRIYDKNGKVVWRFKGNAQNMYDAEHVEIMKGIRSGKVVNNGDYAINSTAMGIMGRMSGYTGKRVTPAMFQKSQEDLAPKVYDMNADIPTPLVAQPGITKFI